MQGVVAKPLHKQIAEHKDVTKIVIQLNGILSGMKPDVAEVLKEFKIYEELWASVSGFYLIFIAQIADSHHCPGPSFLL